MLIINHNPNTMKKYYFMLAAALCVAASCSKNNNQPGEPGGEEAGYVEKTWTLTLNDVDPFTEDYVQGELVFPGAEICAFFGLTQEEFYHAMGTLTGNSDEMATSQEGNTIMFGVADKNNTETLKWIPRTSNGIGHWYTADGSITTWGNETNLAVFYAENHLYVDGWGAETPDAETLEEMWKFDFGYRPGRPEAGKSYKATVVYFYTDDDDVERYAYVEMIMNTKAGERDTWSAASTVEVGGEADELYPDLADMAAYFGLADADALYDALAAGTVYPVGINADGTQYLGEDGKPYYSQTNEDAEGYSARGVFFSKEGNCTTWNSGSDHFYSTIYWYEDDGKTIEIDITPFAASEEDLGTYAFTWGFTNGEKVAYLTINITLETAVPFAVYSIDGTTVTIKMTPNSNYKGLRIDFDNTSMATALGVEDLAAAINDGPVVVVGLNADGSIAMNPDDASAYWNTGEGPYGHWFNTSNNVCGWSTEGCALCFNVKADDGVYVNACQFPETCTVGNTFTVKQRFINGDASVDVIYNVSIVESVVAQ